MFRILFSNTSRFVVLALLVIAADSCTSKSQDLNNVDGNSAVRDAASPNSEARRSLMVCVDKTQSPSATALEQFIPDLKAALNADKDIREIIVLNIGARGEGAWNASAQKFEIPTPPDSVFDEAGAQAEAKKNCGARRNCEDREVREARQQFEANQSTESAAFHQQWTQTIDNVIAAILQRPEKEPRCTNVTEMAERIGQTPASHVVWLSDGLHSCATPLRPQQFPNRVLFAVLPLANEPDNTYGKRLSSLQRIFSNADIKPIAAINDQVVLEFLNSRRLPSPELQNH